MVTNVLLPLIQIHISKNVSFWRIYCPKNNASIEQTRIGPASNRIISKLNCGSVGCIKVYPLTPPQPLHNLFKPLKMLSPNSWDTHVHLFDPLNYPFAGKRTYTTDQALMPGLEAHSRSLCGGMVGNNVLVQPSPYGTDNSLITDTLKCHSDQQAGFKLRGVVVIDPDNTTVEQLQEWWDLGVRGVRVNVVSTGQLNLEFVSQTLTKTAALVGPQGYFIQAYIPPHYWDSLFDVIGDLPVTVIADHLGGMTSSSDAGFDSLIKLTAKNVLIRVSGFYRLSEHGPGYNDLEEVVQFFASETPNKLIWASDWPHTGGGKQRLELQPGAIEPFRIIDNHAILRNLKSWVDERTWTNMMETLPERIYN